MKFIGPLTKPLLTFTSGILLLTPSLGHGFELWGPKWKNGEADIYINLNNPNGTNVDWDKHMRRAIDAWNNTSTELHITAKSGDYHPCAGYPGSGIPEDGNRNSTGFSKEYCGTAIDEDTIAVTSSLWDEDLNLTESDITFNNNHYAWSQYNGKPIASTRDFYRIAAHELGHFIGLDHEDNTLTPVLMHTYDETAADLTQDDINGARSIYPSPALAAAPKMQLNIEEPAPGQIASGVSNIRGWAIAKREISHTEIFLDNKPIGLIPHGSTRNDVANVHSVYPSAGSSGFSMIYNWGLLNPGNHTIKVIAHDKIGNTVQKSVNFTTTSVSNPYINNSNKVRINGTAEVSGNNTITLNDVNADGGNYRMVIEWNVGTQQWAIKTIQAK
ncbi:MAG: matrixin family metalloprotease [Cellvibrionaceae bacterium]|nr:matrixin family metalloprotease [Cellvibrionaceae bacterium]